ncbi:sarcosine oxidase subunit gamma [Rhizobium sp. C4]|uniref:sarcosine oxidase subunit gamma n=1 Tax=Rhizobium sp. C4 TaxID=1349800 RepID=UPI001E545E4E|nr:sarcosine oxidase subunit gamma family protein [Rhizobium sp. C4]MCD2174025.1 sarcosine oxidase subunit gamma family protein [Rhizobium sp. C4]
MLEAQATRTLPQKLSASGSGTASVTPLQPMTRLSLRADADAVATLSKALGVTLPTAPLTSAEKDGRAALWLGPDEWLLIDASGADMMALLAGVNVLHSATDVSHRNTGFEVKGPMAAAAINAACPLDLRDTAFPVGKCARTVLGKIEVIVWKKSADTFHVECWRSFSTYALGMLNEGASDAAA